MHLAHAPSRPFARTLLVILPLMVVAALFLGRPASPSHAQTGVQLPASDWWTVLYVPGNDTLHWINAQGEQISMPRPRLPEEADFGFPEMHIGPNGRMLALAMPLRDGSSYGLGFYDFSTGEFVQTHETQAGEVPRLNEARYASDANSLSLAVGFAYGLNAEQEGWRVIVFDFFSGQALSELRSDSEVLSTYSNRATLPDGAVFPQPLWIERGAGLSAGIHIRLDPIGTDPNLGVRDSAAVLWYPSGRPNDDATSTLYPSPYTARAIDFSRLGNDAIFAYYNGALPAIEVPFVRSNALGRGAPQALEGYPAPEFVYGTGAEAYDRVRWAGDGSRLAFRAIDSMENQQWYSLDIANGQPSALPPNTQDTIGIPGGLLYAADGVISIQNVPATGTGPRLIWDSGLGDVPMYFVWATQPGTDGTLGMQSLWLPEDGVNNINSRPAVAICEQGLPSRLEIGLEVELLIGYGVFFTEDPEQIAQPTTFERLPQGSTFAIVGGPLCVNGFTYWQVALDDGRRGWTVESGETDYVLVEAGTAPNSPPASTGEDIAAETTETSASGTPTPTGESPAVDSTCEGALPAQLTDARGTALSLRETAIFAGEDPTLIGSEDARQDLPTEAVLYAIGGPRCVDGQRYWIFDWQQEDGTWLRGWVADADAEGYLLAPIDPSTGQAIDVPDIPALGVSHCEGAPESRVTIGMQALVNTVDNVPVVLRDEPGGGSIGLVVSGSAVEILDGPACVEGNALTYWRIRDLSEGTEGWIAEGDSISYFIDPLE